MPRVPLISTPSVAPTGLPGVAQTNPVRSEQIDVRNRQVGTLGGAIEGAGNDLAQVQQQLINQANVLRADDAYNEAQEQALRLQHGQDGYTTAKGYDALNRQSGVPLAEEYAGRLDDTINKISDGLGNDQQRVMFRRRAAGLRTNFYGNAMAYTAEQSKVYGLSVQDASTQNASQALVLNASDESNVAYQTARMRASIEGGIDPNTGSFIPGSAQMQGKSASWAKERADEVVSASHTLAIQGFLERGQVNDAAAYRKKYGAQITASDLMKVDGILTRNYDTMHGATVANQVMSSPAVRSTLNPTDFDRLHSVVLGIESGGRRYGPDGKLLTSSKGAQGEMQVMPATQRDPGLGVKPAENDSPEEIARVGREYLAALVKRYDGDYLKATAAYNAGFGTVDKAVKAARDNAGSGETVASDAWIASLPQETRNYVAIVQRKMSNPAESMPQRPTLEQLQGAARAALGPNASPLAVKTAEATVADRFEVTNKAIQQRKDELVARTMQALDQNGGRLSELDPTLRSQVMLHAPEKIDDLMRYGQRVAKGDDITDPRLYQRLSSNPQVLKSLSDQQFYALKNGLSAEDFKHFSQLRGQILTGKAGDSAGDINEQAINRVFNQRLQSLGIQVNPDKRNEAEQMRVGAMRSFIDKAVMAAQRAAGKKLNDVEVAKVVDETFGMNTTFRQSFFSVGAPKSGPMLTATIDTIPKDDLEGIKKAFAAKGISNPTDGQILGVYFEAKWSQARQGNGPSAGAASGGASGSF